MPARAPLGKHAGSTLYVLNTDGGHAFSVSVYASAKGSFLRSIALAGAVNGALAADPAGHLYASGGPDSIGQVHIYSRRGAKLVQTVGGPHRFDLLTLDAFGNLYTQCSGKLVCEYGPSKTHVLKPRPIRKIGLGKLGAVVYGLAVDPSGDLAVNSATKVLVFAPGEREPYWDIPNAGAMVFDSSGNLYIANPLGVAIYAPGGTTPLRTITDGVGLYPAEEAFDPSGNLYVLSYCLNDCGQPPAIAVYAPGGNTPIETITEGLTNGEGQFMTIDGSGNVYVANSGYVDGEDLGNVVVYPPRSNVPERTITQSIANPFALAVGP